VRIGPGSFAVITGGAGGIGSAVATELRARGAAVALVDIDDARLNEIAARLPGAIVHKCDVADTPAMENLAGSIAATHSVVDVLVTCAGISVAGKIEELPLDEIQRCMAVNVNGVVNSFRVFLPLLRAAVRRNGSAAIGNVLSDFSLLSLPTKGAYAASKHAALAFSEAFDAEVRDEGITVTSAIVGATATQFVRRGYAVDVAKQTQESAFLDSGMETQAVARRLVKSIERGRARVVIGNDAHLISLAMRISPRLVQFAARKFWKRIPFL
jgi:short-subunit dehydrogenase